MGKKGITDIFFDLDHTLWDFEKNSALSFKRIFSEMGIKTSLDDFLQVYTPINFAYWKKFREGGISTQEMRYARLSETFTQLGEPISRNSIDSISEAYITYLPTYGNLFPQTKEELSYLSKSYSLHIITNGFAEVQEQKMLLSGIRSFFELVITPKLAGVKKPNPAIFQLALQKAEIVAEQALMIGDDLEADILGAKTQGFNVLHFNPEDANAHEICGIISNLSEIKHYL